MGIGNYLCSENERCVYLDDDDFYFDKESDYPEFDDIAWEDLICNVRGLLPQSFIDENYTKDEHHVISSNGFYEVMLHHYEGYIVLLVSCKEAGWDAPWEFNPLAMANLEKTAESLFSKIAINHHYDMRIRTSAWTSGKYQPQPLAA